MINPESKKYSVQDRFLKNLQKKEQFYFNEFSSLSNRLSSLSDDYVESLMKKIKDQEAQVEKLLGENIYLNKLDPFTSEDPDFSNEMQNLMDLKGFYIKKVEQVAEILEKNKEMKEKIGEKYLRLSILYKGLREELKTSQNQGMDLKKSCTSLEKNLISSQRQRAISLSRLESKQHLLRNQLVKVKHEEKNLNSILSQAHKIMSPTNGRKGVLRSLSQYKLRLNQRDRPSSISIFTRFSRSPISLPINFA
jgi:chromosome segregation ATPase